MKDKRRVPPFTGALGMKLLKERKIEMLHRKKSHKRRFEMYPDEEEKKGLSHRQITLIFFAALWILMNIIAVIYIKSSRNIYFWDAATYWDISREIASGKISPGFWKNVYDSIAQMDYNYVAGLPSAVFVWLFGQSRLVYILSLVNLYAMPSVVMIYKLAKRLGKAEYFSAVAAVMVFPIILFITLIGFVDVGGLLFGLICMYLYFTKSPKRPEYGRHIAIGMLLVLMMIWRRWYAFFAVSFITATIADCVIYRKKIIPVLVTLITSAVIILLFFRGFFYTKLIADYGNMYSGYKFSASTDFKLAARYFGVITVLALAAGSVFAGIKKGEKRTVFLWIQIIVCFIMFISTQTHGQQHLLLYVPAFAVMFIILLRYVNKLWLFGCICLVALCNSINVNIPRQQPNNIQEISHMALIPDFSMRPIKRADTDEMLALKHKLDETIEPGKTVGILASSFQLNEDVLRNVEYSVGEAPAREDYIANLPQVDSRDTDVTELFNVNYMLVATPAQTHLAEGSQKVVTNAVDCFVNYTGFAQAYDEIYDFETTIDNMTLKLYKRNRTVPNSAIREFEESLR